MQGLNDEFAQRTKQMPIPSKKKRKDDEDQEFYSEGTRDLLECRKWLVEYSLVEARKRLEREKRQYQRSLSDWEKERQEERQAVLGMQHFASQIGGTRAISSVAFAPVSENAKRVAVASWSGQCSIWSVPDCQLLHSCEGHGERVGSFVWHPSASEHDSESAVIQLASGGADQLIHLWSMQQSTPVFTLKGHTRRIAQVAWHPSGRLLGSASFDLSWRLWDVTTAKELLLQEGHTQEVYSIAFQGDGSLVATGGLDALGRIWDLRVGRSILSLQGHAGSLLSLDFCRDGYRLVSGSADHTARIWDLRQMRSTHVMAAHSNLVSAVKFSPDSTSLLWTGSFDQTVKGWMTHDNTTFQCETVLQGHSHKVSSLDVQGSWMVTGSHDGTFKLFCR